MNHQGEGAPGAQTGRAGSGNHAREQIEGQTDIYGELERRAAWDELAAGGVVSPLFTGDSAPATASAIFAHGFLRALADSS
jgi:hypothetical protein